MRRRRRETAAGLLGDLADRLVQRHAGEIARRAIVDLVVDVGDVADIGDVRLAIDTLLRSSRNSTSNTMTGRALPICAKS